ncbi:MAG: hypothetical protein A2749_01430 [Parcubacteria group bacterium RIFCSPHIGHO2_01_FULL_45_26]|nr:MAG: hypothetical protein A2749_01430 [Parcubacteria group bacterium RIFCSPHIGHO2_01_FULL_45_26]
MKLDTIDALPPIVDKRIFLRLTLNVPVASSLVTDDFRLTKVLPTLKVLIERGAKVLVGSHIGPLGDSSLLPVQRYLERFLPAGSFSLLPNLRANPGEISNNEDFAKELASLADYYVNEDFPVSHRKHASIVGLPRFLPSFAGYQFAKEVEHLSRYISPPKGSILILGGVKLSTKLPLIKSFLPKVDMIFLGSYYVYEKNKLPSDPKIILPIDVVEDARRVVDVGPRSLEFIQEAVANASAVIWNGPLGKFEVGYRETTEKLAEAIAYSKAESVVGGGDSVAAIRKLDLLDKFTFVSTGGGAMLDFLTHGTLPGIEAILQSKC